MPEPKRRATQKVRRKPNRTPAAQRYSAQNSVTPRPKTSEQTTPDRNLSLVGALSGQGMDSTADAMALQRKVGNLDFGELLGGMDPGQLLPVSGDASQETLATGEAPATEAASVQRQPETGTVVQRVIDRETRRELANLHVESYFGTPEEFAASTDSDGTEIEIAYTNIYDCIDTYNENPNLFMLATLEDLVEVPHPALGAEREQLEAREQMGALADMSLGFNPEEGEDPNRRQSNSSDRPASAAEALAAQQSSEVSERELSRMQTFWQRASTFMQNVGKNDPTATPSKLFAEGLLHVGSGAALIAMSLAAVPTVPVFSPILLGLAIAQAIIGFSKFGRAYLGKQAAKGLDFAAQEKNRKMAATLIGLESGLAMASAATALGTALVVAAPWMAIAAAITGIIGSIIKAGRALFLYAGKVNSRMMGTAVVVEALLGIMGTTWGSLVSFAAEGVGAVAGWVRGLISGAGAQIKALRGGSAIDAADASAEKERAAARAEQANEDDDDSMFDFMNDLPPVEEPGLEEA